MSAVQPIDVETDQIPESEQKYTKVRVNSKLLALAIQFGMVKLGWTTRDYMVNAVMKGRYCVVHVWGEQGNMKSNFTLQSGSWIYGEQVRDQWYPDWDKVLQHLIFRPGREERGLLAFTKSIPHGEREAWIGWDDLGVHYPSTIYRTDMEKYQAVDSVFAAIRTKISTMTTNNPIIDRVAKNIKDNITIEVFIGANQTLIAERFCRVPSHDRVDSYFFKIPIEGPYVFDWTKIPSDVWKEYWELRLRIAEEAINLLNEAYSEEGQLVPVCEVVKRVPPSKLLTYSSKGVVTIIRKGTAKYVSAEDFEILKRAAEGARHGCDQQA